VKGDTALYIGVMMILVVDVDVMRVQRLMSMMVLMMDGLID